MWSLTMSLQLLLSFGVDIERADRFGLTPLATACARGNLYAAGALVNAGARLMARDRQGAAPFP